MDAATRLGEALLRAPKLTQAEVRSAIESARRERATDESVTRLEALVRKLDFTVKCKALGRWMEHARKLAQQIVEEIDATTKPDK